MSTTLKSRQANFELMRIFAMYLILLWHIKGHFMADSDVYHPLVIKVTNLISSCISFHVDLFILMTGYFGVRNNKKAIIKNLLLCTSYLWGLNLVSYFLNGSFEFMEILFPISHGPWWFMTVYFILILIAPFLEKMFSTFHPKDWYLLMLTVLSLNIYFGHYQHLRIVYIMGYDLMNMVTVYCVGAFLRRPVLYEKYLYGGAKKRLVFIFCLLLFLRIIVSKSYKVLNIDVDAGEYCAPLTILLAINVFLIFKRIKLKACKGVLFFSSSAVAVYLITDYPLVRQYLTYIYPRIYSEFCHNSIQGILFVLLTSVFLFVACVLIDKLRIVIFIIIKKIICPIFKKYERYK